MLSNFRFDRVYCYPYPIPPFSHPLLVHFWTAAIFWVSLLPYILKIFVNAIYYSKKSIKDQENLDLYGILDPSLTVYI